MQIDIPKSSVHYADRVDIYSEGVTQVGIASQILQLRSDDLTRKRLSSRMAVSVTRVVQEHPDR